MKKAISALTALVLIFTVFMGVIPVRAEEALPGEQASLENDISVMGTNSFGALLSDELSEKVDEQQQNNGCNIFSAEVTGNKADVSFETVENSTLLVAIYDESGEQMLASGNETVTTDETEKTVTIETDSMPKYFYLKAFLVDTNTLRPICTAYESPNYTKEMQEFFAKTVDDFDSDTVLNLDKDKSNNFAVYGEDTKIIESDGVVNKVTKSDEENGIYFIENADKTVTALVKDDIFALVQPDGNVLIAKIGDIKISGKTVTITEQKTSMEEVFDYVKIDESEGINEDTVVDNSNLEEGVVYNGIVENTSETRTYSQNTYNSDEAYLPSAPNYQASEFEAGGGVSLSYQLDKKIGDDNNNVKLSGSVEYATTASIKVYISDSYSYLEAKLEKEVKVSVSITAKVKDSVPLGSIGISPIPGVYIEFTPSIVFEISGKIQISGTLKASIGFRVSTDEGIQNLSSKPKFEPKLKIEATVFIGISLEPRIKILSEKVAAAGITAEIGVEAKASMDIYKKPSSSSKHECNNCIEGELNIKAKVSAYAKLANKEKWKFSKTLLELKMKISDFYYSIDKGEFGWGTCPYKTYKVSISALDEKKNPVSDAQITLGKSSSKVLGKTDKNGKFETWFSNGKWLITVSKDALKCSKNIVVENNAKSSTFIIKPHSGFGDDDDDPTLPTTPDISVESQRLSLGEWHSAYIDDNGNLYMWGNNYYGEVGNGTTTKSLTPIKIMDNVKSVSLGYDHSAAITEDGDLYMWGRNNYGKLGNGTGENSSTPIKIMDNVKSVSLGYWHSAAITNDGSLYMWGYNGCGQLGNGTKEYSLTPIKIMDNVKAVSLGNHHSAAITNDGSLYMWGHNGYGQLGNGTKDSSTTPIKIMDNVKAVSLGCWYSAAITNDGSLYMWGVNSSGQLGNGESGFDGNHNQLVSSTPIKIMDNVKEVSLGGNYSAAITNDGSLYMWGNNYLGELGNGTTKDSSTPIKVMDNVKAVSLGWSHSGAITNNGSLYMWGDNMYSQLGNGESGEDENGNRRQSTTPIKITMPSDSARTIPNTEYLANESTLKTAEFTGLLPNETYNFYSVLNNELLYVSQGVSDENGNLNVSYIPKKDDTDADIFLKGMTRTDISGAEVTVPDILCNGEEQFAQPVVTLDGVTLSETDYDIEKQYSAVYPCEYDITIIGVGDYIGEVEAIYNVYCKHSFSNGKCTICKSLKGTLGDMNEDGAVGVADIVALQRFLAHKKNAVPQNGDVNGDGKVNVFDAVKLKRIILNA